MKSETSGKAKKKGTHGKTKNTSGKEPVNKVSYHYKPDNLTMEEWQIALRRQAAMKESFNITEINRKEFPGYYQVQNPVNHSEYRVVFRGKESLWNYYPYMDFKTNQLGTCKHLEAVADWCKSKRKRICRELPPYTSVYLSHKGERKVCLRIGTGHAEVL